MQESSLFGSCGSNYRIIRINQSIMDQSSNELVWVFTTECDKPFHAKKATEFLSKVEVGRMTWINYQYGSEGLFLLWTLAKQMTSLKL